MAKIQSANVGGFLNSGQTYTLPSNVTVGNNIIFMLVHSYFGCAASISDNLGTSYTKVIDRLNFGSDSRYLSVWIGAPSSSSSLTITQTFACGNSLTGAFAEFSSLAASPYDTNGTFENNTVTTSVNSGTLTTAQANELVIALYRQVINYGPVTAVGSTIGEQDNSGFWTYQIQSSAGSVTPAATLTNPINTTWPVFGWTVSFKQTSGGGSPLRAVGPTLRRR